MAITSLSRCATRATASLASRVTCVLGGMACLLTKQQARSPGRGMSGERALMAWGAAANSGAAPACFGFMLEDGTGERSVSTFPDPSLPAWLGPGGANDAVLRAMSAR